MIPSSVTTLSLFKYSSTLDQLWAFGMLPKAPIHLQNIKGMVFHKLMGSGKVLGAPWPDWSVYALLQVWEHEAAAVKFINESRLMSKYRKQSKEHCTFFLRCMASHGKWSKQEPFLISETDPETTLPIAVITRATIKTNHLIKFWRQAKKAQEPFLNAAGLLYSKGIGEVPIRQMATFSIWEDIISMKKVAYKTFEHQKAIKMTRQLNWYSEELFAKFSLYRVNGRWGGLSSQLEEFGVTTTNDVTPLNGSG